MFHRIRLTQSVLFFFRLSYRAFFTEKEIGKSDHVRNFPCSGEKPELITKRYKNVESKPEQRKENK